MGDYKCADCGASMVVDEYALKRGAPLSCGRCVPNLRSALEAAVADGDKLQRSLTTRLEAAERGQRDALHDLGIELGARREAEARAEAAERERDDLKIIVVPSLGERLTSAEAAVERLTRERNAQNVLTCVYCGQEYPPGSPTHGASVLTEHIKVCTKHPLRQAEAALAAARAEAGAAYAKGVEAAIQKVREMVESSEEGDPWWAILDEAARALAAGRAG